MPTVDALAYNLWGSADVVCPLMDARRQQTYTGLYDFTDGRMNTILPQCVVMIEEIVDKINELGRRVIFLGDGVDVFRDYINEHVKVDYDFAPAMCNKQRASAVACLGQVLYEQGSVLSGLRHRLRCPFKASRNKQQSCAAWRGTDFFKKLSGCTLCSVHPLSSAIPLRAVSDGRSRLQL